MLNGKYILVTGASSGIGEAITKHLLSSGANVVMVARSVEKMNKIASNNWKGEAFVCNADLQELDSIKSIFDFCRVRNFKLDGIVHCAGITANMPVRVNDVERMDRLLRINVEALIQICKFASSKKYTNDGASIVAMSSSASIRGGKGLSVYSASKAAVNIFVKSAATELSSRGIRINAIAPAMVKTEMYYETIKEIPSVEYGVINGQPLGIIEPVHIAYLSEFLLSEKAKYITGEVIVVGAGNIF